MIRSHVLLHPTLSAPQTAQPLNRISEDFDDIESHWAIYLDGNSVPPDPVVRMPVCYHNLPPNQQEGKHRPSHLAEHAMVADQTTPPPACPNKAEAYEVV
jgi:hypothetical protein